FAQLLEQGELVALRTELEQRRDDFKRKEGFLAQTEKRFNEQFATCELDLIKREAWVSAEHEKAMRLNTRRLQAVVFTDVVSYSALMQVNEGLTIQKVRADLQRMQTEGEKQGGMLVNTMGDGMLMIFPSAIQAVRFSLDMQRALNLASGAEGLRHRFGLHIADVALLPDGGIAGDGVNVASRLEAKAPNGGICLSGVVYAIVKGKLPLPPSAVEEIVLKNIAEPVAAYKYTPEAILAMDISGQAAPPEMALPEEERTAPPFAHTVTDPVGGFAESAGNLENRTGA
ncbi:MAG: adenylate/guanylate cyclase domain-containing protein, partial [bacterium]|nr:adenylate/guanylate cyclase domain-containing protein [bacterium]